MVPDWYAEEDPLASLPPRERAETLDWLQVFVGLPPRDETPRFRGLSRAQLAKFIAALCNFHTVVVDTELSSTQKKGYYEVLDKQINRLVSELTKGRNKDYHYTLSKERRRTDKVIEEIQRKRAAAGSGEKKTKKDGDPKGFSRYLAPHFMNTVGELFGTDAGEDPILSIFSLCTAGAPLSNVLGKYKPLFRVVDGSIQHTPAFAREFAAATGQHSECVARRLARHIYEEGQAPAWAKRRNWPDTTIPYLEAIHRPRKRNCGTVSLATQPFRSMMPGTRRAATCSSMKKVQRR